MGKASTAAAGAVEDGVTSLKVTGSAFDAEKMTVGSLAGGLAKVRNRDGQSDHILNGTRCNLGLAWVNALARGLTR
eukprot:COSAG02_NODE_15008_length_1214_cov_1.244843_2_plen_76_part_00